MLCSGEFELAGVTRALLVCSGELELPDGTGVVVLCSGELELPGVAGALLLCSGEFELPVTGMGTWGVATALDGEEIAEGIHFVQMVEV